MSHQNFIVPSDSAFLEALGEEPTSPDAADSSRTITLESGADDRVVFSFDVPGTSVRIQWLRKSKTVLDLFREGATLVRLESDRGNQLITVSFHTDSLAGDLSIQIWPEVAITDRLLMR
ncbi:hypothetical protein [Kitasatospora sp. NPDC091207]|uniref:hypothetical protein n=1 Tax=Kitasatospora sp. NPDC091207 TaxID=3364083 RepID=UPI00380096C7